MPVLLKGAWRSISFPEGKCLALSEMGHLQSTSNQAPEMTSCVWKTWAPSSVCVSVERSDLAKIIWSCCEGTYFARTQCTQKLSCSPAGRGPWLAGMLDAPFLLLSFLERHWNPGCDVTREAWMTVWLCHNIFLLPFPWFSELFPMTFAVVGWAGTGQVQGLGIWTSWVLHCPCCFSPITWLHCPLLALLLSPVHLQGLGDG